MTKSDELRKIRDEIAVLKTSPLYSYRCENKYFPVIGEGSHEAKIMFVGEAPGENEAKTGRPFCGRAGKVLDNLLNSVGIKREEVYVTNIVKDRPPGNRDPLPDEISLYVPFLDRQIAILKPKVIATLGRFSMQYVMNRYGLEWELAPISVLHGKVFAVPREALAKWGDWDMKVVVFYHPAAAIYNQELLKVLENDFQVLHNLT